ncbi:MAG TPA: hypothetical protein VEZ20_00435 [Allosphingosinicella sp.]|jgi:hypothetical protein|nr:hypothetical protein [Allosphingosinicella sp.]
MWPRSFAHLIAAALLTFAAAPAAAQSLVLDSATGPYVEAIVNGVPLRLRVDFDLLSDISLNPEAAARAGLGNGEGRWVQRIGPVRLRGRTMRTDLTLAGVPARTMIRWHSRAVAEGADGLVSIDALPFDEVTVERRPAAAGERDISFATRVDDKHGLYLPVEVGNRRIAARLSFFRLRTTAPAAAAAVIAQRHGGAIETAPGGTEEVTLGVFRPVYLLELQRPFAVGALAVPRIMVRTADFRGGHRLVRRDGAEAGEAIVVTGERRSQESLYRITIGLDVLDRCSAATYRRLARTLTLRCAG